jgi:uncharacterized protein (DUF885 family)
MFRKAALLAAIIALPIVLVAQDGPTFPAPAVGASTTGLHQLFASYWEFRLAESPELATQVGRPDYNHRWRDWSKAARDRTRAARREFLQQLLYLGTGNLTVSDRVSTHLLEYELRAELDAEPYLLLVQRVSQQNGAHNQVFTVIDQMPARTVKDYENIIARLRGLPVYVNQTIDLMREQLAAGLAQPAVVVDLMLDQVTAQSRPAAADSPLLVAFRNPPDSIPAAERERLRTQAIAAYNEQFVTSWRRLESFLRDTYRRRARPEIALTSVRDGANAYRLLARIYTTTRMTPQQIHELGLQ